MIRYALRCENQHDFESWFHSADAFDTLQSAGHLTCPDCGVAEVAKAPMAPRVRPDKAATPRVPPEEALKAFKSHVESKSEYVGDRFASEARAMHLGDKPERSIYGEARIDEAKKLVEDGIPAMPLPFTPKRKTN